MAADVSSVGVLAQNGNVYLKGVWPKILQVLHVFKGQGLILAVLFFGLSAFSSMAEISITTLSPWKIQCLSGIFREFRIRKVHIAVLLNEYGGTVGIMCRLNELEVT